jgi:hypothetical protein
MNATASDHARALAAQRQQVEHQCVVCGRTFTGTVRAAYCSQTCKNKAAYARHAEQRRAHRRASYRARKQAGEGTS